MIGKQHLQNLLQCYLDKNKYQNYIHNLFSIIKNYQQILNQSMIDLKINSV